MPKVMSYKMAQTEIINPGFIDKFESPGQTFVRNSAERATCSCVYNTFEALCNFRYVCFPMMSLRQSDVGSPIFVEVMLKLRGRYAEL